MVLELQTAYQRALVEMTRRMLIREKVHGFAEPLSEHLPASDRLEGVAEVLDRGSRLVVGPDDRHDIEATPHFEHVVFAHELHRNVCQPPLFLRSDSLGGNAPPPRLHFNENQRVTLTRDQVDFTLLSPITAQQDAHALAFQMTSRGSLTALSQQPVQEGSYN